MANPFLVLGGIAVGIVTAAFGILQVPGWVASAQDASAKNDIAQISIGQAASLSATGLAKGSINGTAPTGINTDPAVGVTVTTQATADTNARTYASANSKNYIVVVRSASGAFWARGDGGQIVKLAASVTAMPADYTAANTAVAAGTPG